ncbi:MAG TPA: hypothetical protein PK910_07825 [Bacteroidales bacterium]|nr:hypothetical protein [Bacteroidales bacterium]
MKTITKPLIIKTGFFILIILIMGAGCEDDKRDSSCYEGKVISLNQQTGCQNIIEISKTPFDGELSVGTTISFNPVLYGNKLTVGDLVSFKVLEYEEFGDIIMPHHCFTPQYAALIEFCNK